MVHRPKNRNYFNGCSYAIGAMTCFSEWLTDSRYSDHFTVIYLPILKVYTKYQRYILEET